MSGQKARSEPCQPAIDYLKGLLSDGERKNGWQIPESSARKAITAYSTHCCERLDAEIRLLRVRRELQE